VIRVLIVDDSPVVRHYLQGMFGADPGIEVVGTAEDGEEAVRAAALARPDVITMDVEMPRMDGFEATRRIMEARPVPIVIVTASWNRRAVTTTFRAMNAGAVAVVEKPLGVGHPEYEDSAKRFVQTIKLMSGIQVVRPCERDRREPASVPAARCRPAQPREVQMVAVGASVGGPPVLQTLLQRLPQDFAAPVLITQHIAPGFVEGLAVWLREASHFPVHVATHGERLLPGHAYIAPDGRHMGVDGSERVVLSHDEAENGLRPAVSYLFRAVARVAGPKSIGVLLTGMGRDGAQELKLIRDRGGITIAQDRESSVVHGMPGEACHVGAAMHVLPPEEIAALLGNLVQKK
jgi:two-component system chemotaxis response regulator CheB